MKAKNIHTVIQSCMLGRYQKPGHKTLLPRLSCILWGLILSGNTAVAQSFSSGSNGSDGALNFATPGIVDFNPRTNVPPLDVDGDNVFHFTTINIGAGVTVRLSGQVFNGPVNWLASGDVTISGTLDLNGENGHPYSTVSSVRWPSIPGAGGYVGGVGGTSSNPPQPGAGPGGGGPGGTDTGGPGRSGIFTGNQFLVPLIGGSGGGGGGFTQGTGGGAGGGAILIASSGTISIVGVVRARGGTWQGDGNRGGGGSGGAIRLVANTISGTGTIDVTGGAGANIIGGTNVTGPGKIRIEAFQSTFNGFKLPDLSVVFLASPAALLPTAPASVQVTSVGGIPVPPNPGGSFQVPDTTITSAAAVTVAVQAKNIPVGTVLKLYIYSENGPDITADTTALQGTTGLSTATAQVTFPPGFSRGFVRATWTQ